MLTGTRVGPWQISFQNVKVDTIVGRIFRRVIYPPGRVSQERLPLVFYRDIQTNLQSLREKVRLLNRDPHCYERLTTFHRLAHEPLYPVGSCFQQWTLLFEVQRGRRVPVVRRWVQLPWGERKFERMPARTYRHLRGCDIEMRNFVIRRNQSRSAGYSQSRRQRPKTPAYILSNQHLPRHGMRMESAMPTRNWPFKKRFASDG